MEKTNALIEIYWKLKAPELDLGSEEEYAPGQLPTAYDHGDPLNYLYRCWRVYVYHLFHETEEPTGRWQRVLDRRDTIYVIDNVLKRLATVDDFVKICREHDVDMFDVALIMPLVAGDLRELRLTG